MTENKYIGRINTSLAAVPKEAFLSKLKSSFSKFREAVKLHWLPILLLMVLSPFLAEVLSDATPVFTFFTPGTFFSYAIFLYGIPVLIIREMAIHMKLGVVGLWWMGLIYGLVNEGFFAGTIFHNFRSPIETFAEYGLILNIRVPWMLYILIWHAFFSVVFPITIVHRLQSKKADEQWLSLKTTWALGLLEIAVPFVKYFSRTEEDLTMRLIHYGFLIVAVALIWFVASKLPRSPNIITRDHGADFSLIPLLVGAAAYFLLEIVPVILAENKIHYVLFILYYAVLVTLGIFAICSRKETTRNRVLLFVLGCETIQTLFGVWLGLLDGNIVWSATSAAFVVIFIAAVTFVKLKAPSRKSLQIS